MPFATINPLGQVDIPPETLRSLDVEPGERIEFVQLEPGKVLLVAVNRSVTELKGLFGEVSKTVSLDEMNRAIIEHGASAG